MKRLKKWKTIFFIITDIMLVNLAYLLAFYFRFMLEVPTQYLKHYLYTAGLISLIYIGSFYVFRLYKSLWTYASIGEFVLIVGGCIIASFLSIISGDMLGYRLPYSVNILAAMINILFVGGFRMSFRVYRFVIHINTTNKKDFKRVMIIGAGDAGTMLIKEMKLHPEMRQLPVVLIDDDQHKIGTSIGGVKVFGNRNKIVQVVKSEEIENILVAIPSIDYKSKKEILNICKQTGCKVEIIPGVYELIDGKVSLKKVRDVSYEDLLGRSPVQLDIKGIDEYISGKTIMITGGGGSIGSELCRQIAKFNPKEVILFDNYENGVYELQQEFRYSNIKIDIKCVIASITDRKRLKHTFDEYHPEIIFHAAAHKHVPLMEDNPAESVINNVFGTLNLAECADKYGVSRFVMISTDKAVNPTNIMGATKRLCEMIIQSMDKNSNTQFVAVRFGNVLGSNGSVIPLFKKQIAHGGPVTVTHPNINRFFMTIPEAAQLVLQAGAFAKGGEIFVLDMHEPVKIYDLACDLIKLSGFEPNIDIKIDFIGLRPGEKLYEEVLTQEEGLNKTVHEKIFVGKPTFDDLVSLKIQLEELKRIAEEEKKEALIHKMRELVPTYKRETHDMVAAGVEG